MGKTLTIEVWSDLVCPWCYLGKRRLDAALREFPEREAVQVVWRSFELDPSASREPLPPQAHAEMLARKYGRTLPQAQQMLDQMTKLAAGEGLAFDYARIRTGNSFDAHRLLHLARELGQQATLAERLFAAYFCEGQAISDGAMLVKLAGEVGIDVDRAQAVITTDQYAAEVRAEEREAHQLGIQGVPFFLLGRRYGVSGAQSREVLVEALTRAYRELAKGP